MSERRHVALSDPWEFAAGKLPRWRIGRTRIPLGERVNLPHSWNTRDTFQTGVEYRRGWGTYRLIFGMPPIVHPDRGRLWFIRSEGFYGTGDAWLNGARIGGFDAQYLGLTLNVTRHMRLDAVNTLVFRLTNRCPRHVLPGIRDPDFVLHGGLAGRVWLEGVPALHLDAGAIHVIWPAATGSGAAQIRCAVTNAGPGERRFSAVWRIEDDAGRTVAEVCEDRIIGEGTTLPLTANLDIPHPRLWTLDDPYLYRASCAILEASGETDHAAARFGCHTAEFRPGRGFFLNGQRVELRGCNRHESMPGFANALPPCQHREDALLIKQAGLNFARLSHCPQHPAFLDACDELGILAYAEIATWKSVRTGRWLAAAVRQMRAMIRRDRNHPCIILWGMGNESRSRKAYLALRSVVREQDPSRPVIYAENHIHRARRSNTLGLPDVWGCNYELDRMAEGCRASALQCVVVSEMSNHPAAVRGNRAEEARQVEIIERDLAAIEGEPAVAGFALWAFNDYATLRNNRYLRHSGIYDAWRLPKMSVALLQARYSPEPVVKLFGDWTAGVEADAAGRSAPRPVHVFTNCRGVTLYRNGREIAHLSGHTHYSIPVEFEPGELVAVADAPANGVSDRLSTPGPAEKLALAINLRTGPNGARQTPAFVVRVLDREGRLIMNAAGDAEVTIRGPAILQSYSPQPAIAVAGGVGRGFITLTHPTGIVELTVSWRGIPTTTRIDLSNEPGAESPGKIPSDALPRG
jgi:beta-galactosidase